MRTSYIDYKMDGYRQARQMSSTLTATGGVLDFFRDPGQGIVNIFIGGKATTDEVRAKAEQLLLAKFPTTLSEKSANRLLYLAKKGADAFIKKLDEEYAFFKKTRSKIFGAENVVAERWLQIKNEFIKDLRNLSYLRRLEKEGNFNGRLWYRHLTRFWLGLARGFEAIDDMVDAQYFGQDWARVAFNVYGFLEGSLSEFFDIVKETPQKVAEYLKYATYAGIGLGAYYIYTKVKK